MHRQRQLDGIRGVAILMVMMYHSLLLPIGWVGVDMFFTLSGFLITRILFETRQESYYWQSFYIKRTGRILPPLLVLFALVFILSKHRHVQGMLGYALFLGDYLNTTAYVVPLLVQLWSLAIEEHFYMVWPIAVRSLSRRRLAQLLICVLAVEPVLRLIFHPLLADVMTIYYFTPFRLDSIAAGSLLALTMGNARAVQVLRRISPTLVAGSVVLYGVLRWELGDAFTRERLIFGGVGYSLVAIGSFGLVAHVVLHDRGRLAGWLSVPPLLFLGEISYGLYLFHPIVRSVTKALLGIGYGAGFEIQERWLFVPDFLISALVCALLFHFYEKPIVRAAARTARGLRKNVELSAV
jgi:peptidoglycan/LPS O-acetylase OafA/YrhL